MKSVGPRGSHRGGERRRCREPITATEWWRWTFSSWTERMVKLLSSMFWDHGTGFQVCEVVSREGHKDAESTWRAFEKSWLRYFGPPEILMPDGGGEFQETFERGCEHDGIFQHICDAYSPWRNGRCERHGGWIKEVVSKTAREMEPKSREEMESIIHEAVSSKNRHFHRGGFSPYQLVIGENPRLPK